MAMTVRVMEIINKARVEVEKIKEEKLAVEKRLDQFLKRVETIQNQYKQQIDQLGVSPADLEKKIRKGDLNKEGVDMFAARAPGGADHLSSALKTFKTSVSAKELPVTEEKTIPVKKKRLRINL